MLFFAAADHPYIFGLGVQRLGQDLLVVSMSTGDDDNVAACGDVELPEDLGKSIADKNALGIRKMFPVGELRTIIEDQGFKPHLPG